MHEYTYIHKHTYIQTCSLRDTQHTHIHTKTFTHTHTHKHTHTHTHTHEQTHTHKLTPKRKFHFNLKVYASALAAAQKNDKLQKLRSHELNSHLAYVREADADLTQAIESILVERKQSFVVLDQRVSRLRRRFEMRSLAGDLGQPAYAEALTYAEVAELHDLVSRERHRLRARATSEDPHEDDVAQYLDVIQVGKKLEKLFARADPPLQSPVPAEAAKEVKFEPQARDMADYLFAVKTAAPGAQPLETLKRAAEKCGFDISLYQKPAQGEICELRVAGVDLVPPQTVASRGAFLQAVLNSLTKCDFLKIVAKKDSRELSLAEGSDEAHVRYDQLCGPKFVARKEKA